MDDDAQQSTDFLLATRMCYELQQRAAADDPEPQPVRATERDEDQDLRAADFLVATRAMHEVSARNLGRRQGRRRAGRGQPQREP